MEIAAKREVHLHNYFAVQTHKAEMVEQRLLEFERIKAREKQIKLKSNCLVFLYEGVDSPWIYINRVKGDQSFI